jgi:DNA-binding MarR family transcriptional regulator
MANDSRQEAEEIADRLHSAVLRLLRSLRRNDLAMGLSSARASALSVLVFGGPLSLGRLAEIEQVSAPTMTRLVQGLERQGLVRRETDPEDRRSVRVRATPKGVRLLEAGRKRRVEDLMRRLAALSPAERALLADAAPLLERLRAAD